MRTSIRAAAGAVAATITATGLAVAGASPAAAQSAPDGRIVYVQGTGYGTNTSYDIHVMNADGTGDVNLTEGFVNEGVYETTDSLDLEPVWSPDGTRIAFISNRTGETNPDGNLEIFAMDADGGDVVQITHTDPPNDWDWWQSYDPSWSPDGTRIVFSGYRQWSSSELFVVPADGSGAEVHITDGLDPANKWEPQWSPDGSTILFTWGWDEYSQDLHTIAPDGSGETDLTPGTVDTSERNPAWSPDGTRIAFRTDRDPGGIYPNVNAEIYVMEHPSGLLTRVTDDPTVDEDPAWSPDGSRITFTSLRGGGYDLYVVDAPPVATPAGRTAPASASTAGADTATRLTTGDGAESDPSWTAGAADVTAPRSTLSRPRDGRTYARADLRQVRGSATDDTGVARVQVALRRDMADGSSQWWDGSAWTARPGTRPLWHAASGGATFAWNLPRLTVTTGDGPVASYTVLTRAGDAAGNVESTLRAGRNQATFEIS